MRFKIFVTTLFYSFGFIMFSQNSSETVSLEEAISFGLQNNNDVKNARIDYLSAKKRTLEIMSLGFPKINGKFDYNNFFQIPTQLLPGEIIGRPGTRIPVQFSLPQNMTIGLEASQLVFDGRYFIGVKATKDLESMTRQQVLLAEATARKEITKAYYTALVSAQSQSLLLENKQHLEKIIVEMKALYSAGFVEELDVNKLELSLANLNSTIRTINNQSQLASSNLKFLIGKDMNTELVFKENLNDLLSITDATILAQTYNPENRIENNMLNLNITLQGYDVKQKQAQYLPSVFFYTSYGTNAQREKFNFFNDGKWFAQGLWGFTMRMSIFDGMTTYAQVQQAKLNQLKAQNNYENFQKASSLQVAAAKTNYESAILQYNDQKQNIELAQKILTKQQIKFKEGVGSSFELSQAETDYTTAQLNLLNTILKLLTNKTDLETSLKNTY